MGYDSLRRRVNSYEQAKSDLFEEFVQFDEEALKLEEISDLSGCDSDLDKILKNVHEEFDAEQVQLELRREILEETRKELYDEVSKELQTVQELQSKASNLRGRKYTDGFEGILKKCQELADQLSDMLISLDSVADTITSDVYIQSVKENKEIATATLDNIKTEIGAVLYNFQSQNGNTNAILPSERDWPLQKVSVTGEIADRSKIVLGNNLSRKEEWDIVRGRLVAEFNEEVQQLNTIRQIKKTEYSEKADRYGILYAETEYPGKDAEIRMLSDRMRILNNEISKIDSYIRYAKLHIGELSVGLDFSKKTFYMGCGGYGFTDIHGVLIHQQGVSHPNFYGTCGLCSCANAMTLLGDKHTELDMINTAIQKKLCTNYDIKEHWSERKKEKYRRYNGGTSVHERRELLNAFGYNCIDCKDQSLRDIYLQVKSGKAAIINVDADVLNKNDNVSKLHPKGTNHALTITGFECDSDGIPIGMWIHDTGVISNMGNAFYCNISDYEVWKKTNGCTVQYVSKRIGVA